MKQAKTITAILLFALVAISPALAMQNGFWSPSIKVLHASPDAPAVDVWANGAPLFTSLAFGQTQKADVVPRGTYQVQVVPAGATEPAVIDARLRLNNVRDYTVIAIGNLNSIEPLVLTDRVRADRRNSLVRFVHASPDAPAVDIRVKDGPVVFGNVAFKGVQGHKTVAPGTYNLEVLLAGTNTVVLELNGITFEQGKAYTAVAIGEAGKGTLTAALLEDQTRPRN